MQEFESEEGYYQPVEIESEFDKNSVTCEFNVDRDKTLSLNQYLEVINPYLQIVLKNLVNRRLNYQLKLYLNH